MNFLSLFDLSVLDTTVRLATPLLLACLAGLFSERAGIFDIGLEGKMLAAAFFSAAVAAITGSVWIGLGAGIGASLALSAVHGLSSITFRGTNYWNITLLGSETTSKAIWAMGWSKYVVER